MFSRQIIPRSQSQPPFYVGVDLGGSSSKIGVVDNVGNTLSYINVPTAIDHGPENGAERIGHGALEALRKAGVEVGEVRRVGLGSPGTMDLATGMLIQPVNLRGWDNFPLRDRLSHYCGLPVTFANDGAAAAFGEFWLGAGREMHSLVMFTLGTGIGCGIIVDGASIDGRHSHGAECGHIAIDFNDDSRMCSCGQPGHLEAYASATALVKRTIEALESGMKTSLNARLEHGVELSPIVIGQEAEAGDSLCLELVLDTARYLAVGIVTLMHTIDPDGVVLGGAMTFGGHNSPLGRQFLHRIREEVRHRAFPILAQQTTIDYARLGSDAGYLGAAGLARAESARLSARG
jgi:glucokinase